MIYLRIIALFWGIFALVWLVSAFGVKKDVRNTRWWQEVVWRLVIGAVTVLILEQSHTTNRFKFLESAFGPTAARIGVVVCGLGIAFAIWARVHLGKNWSASPAIKENHELVTSGPYSFVRHPIYTGIAAAFIGSGLAGGPAWLLSGVLLIVIFILRIPQEEKFMLQLFPNQYPAYKARTKALIPFVW
jgi:protein-S-isoprenylcysteine O-methyltransferase Ste14